MCYVCCKELKCWCKSFTRTEGLLSVLEAILLVVFISFLVFLILHSVACRTSPEAAPENVPKKDFEEHSIEPYVPKFSSTEFVLVGNTPSATQHSTQSPGDECTWEPSQPSSARTRHFLSDPSGPARASTPPATIESLEIFGETLLPSHDYDDVEFLEQSDGEPAEERYKSQVVALVKIEPPGDMTFGCILTKITKFWTLTAASCIEAIEEVDSLDSFVIVEQFGSSGTSRPRAVAGVRLHARGPGAPGGERAHDLAALRAARALSDRAPPLRLPRLLDYFLVALGERFHILGYGGYRTVEARGGVRPLRQVSVFVTAPAACAAAGWAPRHLLRGAAARAGACGAAPLCAGSRYSRGTPCNYCAGAPLLRRDTLYGIMSDNSACGVACEPQLYVNIAMLRDWIDSVIE